MNTRKMNLTKKVVYFGLEENNDIREELKTSFGEIMVDEYQDTSNIQEEFIEKIKTNCDKINIKNYLVNLN